MGKLIGYLKREYVVGLSSNEVLRRLNVSLSKSSYLQGTIIGYSRFRMSSKSSFGVIVFFEKRPFYIKGKIEKGSVSTKISIKIRSNLFFDFLAVSLFLLLIVSILLYVSNKVDHSMNDYLTWMLLIFAGFLVCSFLSYFFKMKGELRFNEFIEEIEN